MEKRSCTTSGIGTGVQAVQWTGAPELRGPPAKHEATKFNEWNATIAQCTRDFPYQERSCVNMKGIKTFGCWGFAPDTTGKLTAFPRHIACLCGSLAQCALSLKRLSAGPGFNPQTRQNKLFQDYWRACFEINFSDRQEGLTVSSIICDR